ncbi:uncharacterized protein [Cicer arietinum]|uniref:Uncharacterized protein LOC101513330 n=1 Tax=Cicer arietinum TaxID=3827 RepID=A0A1S2YXD8_CICAR|nr:uncharacterized protein LOC101513330 [Cicer arietinum]
MEFLNSIKQVAGNLVTKVEDLFSLQLLRIFDANNSEILPLNDTWTNCPFKGCSVLLLNEGIEFVTNVECPSCHGLFCAQCNVPWHVGLTCQEFQFQRKHKCFAGDSQNHIPKKRKSFFEDCENDENNKNEKKKKKLSIITESNNQVVATLLLKLKGILKRSKYVPNYFGSFPQSPKSFCGICFDFIQEHCIAKGSTTCNHLFCANCISKHVATHLSQNIIKVYCPNPNCYGELKPRHLQHILPKEVIDRWESAILDSTTAW